MPSWTPGQRIVVRYENDQTLWHERIVLAHLEPAAACRFRLASLDLEIINECVSSGPNVSADSTRLTRRTRVVFGVDGNDVYIVEDSQPRALNPGEVQDLVDVAMMLAALTGGAVGDGPPPPPPPAGAPPGLGGDLVAVALRGVAMSAAPAAAATASSSVVGAGAGAPCLAAVAPALKVLSKEALASKERKEAEEEQALVTKGGKQ
jgi:hypothetical protein